MWGNREESEGVGFTALRGLMQAMNCLCCLNFDIVFIAVMFIVSLSNYSQRIWKGEGNINRMVEAERLFAEMLNNVFFRETPFTVFVFFNKWDVFKDRLRKVPLTEAYKDYTGPDYTESEEVNVEDA